MSQHLTAVYTSPTATHTLSSSLPASGNTLQEKSHYLTDLRQNISQMQNDINAYLTQKMEEDKAQETKGAAAKDEEREEQMYGEENVDED